ncbi:unnamed protein product [Rhizoctonia solani]|uniref:Uncharacterized protein n=1 Tax=Rhizoctonia solani TaxID=456999 RepID=A0A8H3CVW4_9AGAM|nr:unnamed protein product [Rhizoctonia solani]
MARVAIVTGSAQGIGRAIALRLASDGNDVAVNDINLKQNELEKLVEEIKRLGRKAISIPGDVSKEQEVQNMVTKTVDELGSLDIVSAVDIMVANAGIHIGDSIIDMPDENFDRVMNVNCKGVLYCYRAAAVQMIKQGKGGRIIGASSVWGLRPEAYNVAYCTSKFAVRAITQTAALEWGQYNITVNAYAPGLTETPMVAAAGLEVDVILPGACMKRIGQPEEVAALVGFLASEGASYVTAEAYNVAYSTSKFAIRAITQTAALEWGQQNITVNAYAPGLIETPMVAAAGLEVSEILPGACMKRIGQPKEVAALVGFLASEGATYVTGERSDNFQWI